MDRIAAWPWWVKVAVVYLGLRLVSGLLLAQAAQEQVWFPAVTGPAEDDIDLAVSWDAKWYERIVDGGYPAELPVGADGRVQQNPWAFYPLFPYAIRLVSWVTTLDFATVAPLLALLAGLGAALLMAALLIETTPYDAESRHGPALAVVAVWAALPAAPVLQMAYTESFSMLLLTAFLLLLVRGHWVGTGLTALLLGLTRPIALPLLLVVLVALVLRWRDRAARPIAVRERVGMAAALGGTGVSGLLWTATAWAGTGRHDAYPATMTAWRGEATINPIEPWRRTLEWAVEQRTPETVVPALSMSLALLLSLALLVPRVAPGIDVRLRVWAAAYAVYLLAVVDGGTSIVRYLVPLFPLAIVLVGAHRERLSRWWRWRTAFWVAVGVVGQVGWIWWLVLFEPPTDFPP
ncbi:hypothetical protein [Nocardioides sp.]|uniref:hypothetical protein n=1 Tax=Nocardioides sp. TaxID=35761 RepID=UPI002B2747C1|nr:hypothetical protein [Nocardioides sp.]